MDRRWSAAEKAAVHDFLGAAIVGGPETVGGKLDKLVEATQADELMIHSGFYRHEDRKRSYGIVAEVVGWSSAVGA
jgi:alkanesulfonate monooxygenase SsuD/methylene tetrahydromethanopterin reductase-like flavin-dependent oxidoreductase (luciferase family)